MRRQRVAIMLICAIAVAIAAHAALPDGAAAANVPAPAESVRVVELRRYTIKAGQRDHFAEYFETYFPEAFQQLGALLLGQFLERDKPDHFLWLRAFRDMDDRAKANASFYYGPVWKEHRATMNALIDDSDDVLLLQPCDAGRPVLTLPAVDPVTEPGGAGGRAVAVIYPVKKGAAEQFARNAESTFRRFRAADVREAAVLCSLDAANNFPQLPIRTDGPFVVWVGVMRDETALLDRFVPIEESSRPELERLEQLTGPVERVMLTPTRRSRLRWMTAG